MPFYFDEARFRHAAQYVNEKYFSQPYSGWQDGDSPRDFDQRALILLADGRILQLSGKLAKTYTNPQTGKIDEEQIKKLEQDYQTRVIKKIERPNHGLRHSMRAAKAIPGICAFHSKIASHPEEAISNERQSRLKLMMLFSVVGRNDETGFSDSQKLGDYRYQEFRANSAKAFLEYCLQENIYGDDLQSLYEDALAVELMGFPKPPEIYFHPYDSTQDTPKPMPKIAKEMRGKDLRIPNLKDQANTKIDDNFATMLDLMNAAHEVELLRCYQYDPKFSDAPKTKELFYRNFRQVLQLPESIRSELYPQALDPRKNPRKTQYKDALAYILYQARMMEQTGERMLTKIVTSETGIDQIIDDFMILEQIFYSESFHKAAIDDEVLRKLYHEVLLDEAFLKLNAHLLIMPSSISDEIQANSDAKDMGLPFKEFTNAQRYPFEHQSKSTMLAFIQSYYPKKLSLSFETHIFGNGDNQYQKAIFDSVQYHKYGDLSTSDTDKEVDLLLHVLEQVPVPHFVVEKKVSESITPLELLPAAVKAHFLDESVQIIYANANEAQKAMSGFVAHGLLHPAPTIEHRSQDGFVSVTMSKADYAKLDGKIRYRLVQIPKIHSVEDDLLDEEGQLKALSIISQGDAVTRVLNGEGTHDPKHPDYDFKLKHLEDPIHLRETKELRQLQGFDVFSMFTTNKLDTEVSIEEMNKSLNRFTDRIPIVLKDGNNKVWVFGRKYDNDTEVLELNELKHLNPELVEAIKTRTPQKLDKKYLDIKLYTELRPYHVQYSPEEDRKQYTDAKFDRTYVRQSVKTSDPHLQPPKSRAQAQRAYTGPGTLHETRSQPMNTPWAKKDSHSLLPPHGKMHSYEEKTKTWLPIGFLSDLNEVDLKGERYIWSANMVTNIRFWLANPHTRHLGTIPEKIKERKSVAELKAELAQAAVDDKPFDKWNELLIGPSKAAVKALFIPSDMSSEKEKRGYDDQLILRLNVLYHAIQIKEKYNYDVPILIIDGVNPPKLYSEQMIKKDLQDAAQLLAKNSFPYLEERDKKIQENVLRNLFQHLANTDELTAIPHDKKHIDTMLVKLNIVGGAVREFNLYNQEKKKYKDNPQQLLEIQKRALNRAVVLGHRALVEIILKEGLDVNTILNEKTGNTALHYAGIANNKAIADFLKSKGADATIKNKEGKYAIEYSEKYKAASPERKEKVLQEIKEGVPDKRAKSVLPQQSVLKGKGPVQVEPHRVRTKRDFRT